MKLLLNDKEIAHFLSEHVDYLKISNEIEFDQIEINEVVSYILEIKEKPKKFNKFKSRFKDKIIRAVTSDLKNYVYKINHAIDDHKAKSFRLLHKNIETILEKMGEETVLESYKNSKEQNFIKGVGYQLNSDAVMIRRKHSNDYTEDCLIRNTVGNEDLLISKIDNNLPFWFIDSGYTNFLESNKLYHRLVRNHLHHSCYFEAPVDRLGVFKKFPQQWRTAGDRILIIEPGPFAAGIFHIDLKTWKYQVEAELRNYTDKPIVFREKIDRKKRTNLYEHLCNEDYYCVVNINSNAATESIWAGVPVITLDKHISNAVTKNKLSDINNLARPNLSNWLCMLSYSQFTYDELMNGTAVSIARKYHV